MERNQAIDLVKIVAMFGVLGLHTTHDFIIAGNYGLANALYSTCVISIPLFFMVSGYLLLGRPNANYKYVYHKIKNILRYVLAFVCLYFIFWSIKHGTFDILMLFKSCIYPFIQRGPFSMFWYLGAMIVIYLFYPIVNKLYTLNIRSFLIFFGILFLLEYIIFQMNLTGTLWGGEFVVNQTFRMWNWMFYFCLGGLLKRFPITISWFFLPPLIIGNLLVQYWQMPAIGNTYCEYFYSSVIIMLFSSMTFLFICGIRFKSHNWLISKMSDLFLPVYTFHQFVIIILNRFVEIHSVVVYFIMVSVVSLGVSVIIMAIPGAKKFFKI